MLFIGVKEPLLQLATPSVLSRTVSLALVATGVLSDSASSYWHS